jgi:hypothetical protein
MEGRSGAPEAAPERTQNLTRNEKDRERLRVGGARHAQALADKQAEIDHLRGSLTGVLGQMENFKGVAEIIRDYQKSIQPWDDNNPVDLTECRGCGGRGIRDGMGIARLTAICRKTKCGPLENLSSKFCKNAFAPQPTCHPLWHVGAGARKLPLRALPDSSFRSSLKRAGQSTTERPDYRHRVPVGYQCQQYATTGLHLRRWSR